MLELQILPVMLKLLELFIITVTATQPKINAQEEDSNFHIMSKS